MAATKTDHNVKSHHKGLNKSLSTPRMKNVGATTDKNEASVSKTRVCFRNLPPSMTSEVELQEYLLANSKSLPQSSSSQKKQQKLHITDCKILKSIKTGRSRHVAFVGFKDAEQAAWVIQQFDRTYMKSCRITVVPALLKQNEGEHEREGIDTKSSAALSPSPAPLSKKIQQSDRSANNKVKEFLEEINTNRTSKAKFWANDVETSVLEASHTKSYDEDNDDSTSSSGSSGESSNDDDDRDHQMGDIGGSDATDTKNNSKSFSDLDFLRSKQTSSADLDQKNDLNDGDVDRSAKTTSQSTPGEDVVDDDDDDDDISSDSSDSSDEEDVDDAGFADSTPLNDVQESDGKISSPKIGLQGSEGTKEEEEDARHVAASNRLFVRNLPFEATEEELEEHFSIFGTVVECHIPVDDQHRNKGYAFVTYESHLGAHRAQKDLHNVDFQGRLLQILPARPPPGTDKNVSGASATSLSWKQKQELARKDKETKSGGDTKSWSTTFVRADAVIDNLAERLGLRKGDLLGVKDKLSSGDAAVRLALGETKIIEENREYFRSHGVDMEALVSAHLNDSDATQVQRSRKDILVKNLPFDTRVEELTKLFHVGNASLNILLPPSRTIALVQYSHQNDAKKAFRKLAYRRFKHVPIYLEWAPLDAGKGLTVEEETKSSQAKDPVTERSSSRVNEAEDEETATDEFESSSVYVKNLSFKTTEETLRAVFESKVGPVVSIRIPRKAPPSPSNPAAEVVPLSMGYGFVELPSQQIARTAVKQLQDVLVDGHELKLAISSVGPRANSKSSKTASSQSGKSRTKIIVRNVPFQATRTDILKLFGSFGQLKKVRLPKKFDGTHRGFAFVDFLTAKEAEVSMQALSRTHLFGRHLVMEWASDDAETVEELRSKAKRDVGGVIEQQQPKNKKIKFT